MKTVRSKTAETRLYTWCCKHCAKTNIQQIDSPMVSPTRPASSRATPFFRMILCAILLTTGGATDTRNAVLCSEKRFPFRTSGHVMSRSHQSSRVLLTLRTITWRNLIARPSCGVIGEYMGLQGRNLNPNITSRNDMKGVLIFMRSTHECVSVLSYLFDFKSFLMPFCI